MKTNFEESQEVTKKTMEVVSIYFKRGDSKQASIGILPIISNAMFLREKEILEQERVKTIFALAKTLDFDNFKACIDSLGFNINLEKN